MKIYQPLLITVAIIAFSCGKDKFTTIPQVRIESIKPGTVNNGSIISLKGSYTDQEGDIDSVFIVEKFYAGATASYVDTFQRVTLGGLNLPDNTREAGFEIRYEYNTQNTGLNILSGVQKDTTATLGVVFIDKKGNRSEFKESDKIRLLKP